MKYLTFCFIFYIIFPVNSFAWGFFGHQRINRLAVFSLPPEMIIFYKKHIIFLTENAVNPDKRRYAVAGEAPRHYIDMEDYNATTFEPIPKSWKDAVLKYSFDSLMAHGIVPWHINQMKYELQQAFEQRNVFRILRLSADLGHYIADANVPLHTTRNYNGQMTNQAGIHGFWESRLPELYSDEYDFFVGKPVYIRNPQEEAWNAVLYARAALDSVLTFEKELSAKFPEDKKYSFEQRGNLTVKVYSKAFSKAYHEMLKGQVERQMRNSIRMISSFWYTCWVDAGQPDLAILSKYRFNEQELIEIENEKKELEQQLIQSRPHEAAVLPSENLLFSGDVCCETFYAFTPKAIRKRIKQNIKPYDIEEK